jgi:hypothetical protein
MIIGGVLALAGGFLSQWWQKRQERKALAHALSGEISAIIEIGKHRGYMEGMANVINQARLTGEPCSFRISIKQSYMEVYQANVDKIGLLPQSIAADVVKFYTFTKSVIEDMTVEWEFATAEDSVRFYQGTLELMGKMMVEGEQVATVLADL